MTRQQRELEQRRLALVARSATQRASIAGAVAPIIGKLATLDRIGTALRRHTVAVAAVAGVVALFGSRRLILWATRALAVYSLVRRI